MRSLAVHRVLDAELTAANARRADATPRVLDVGGGSGVWAVPLARSGCRVTVVDPSPNALATLRRRAEDAGVGDRIEAVQGDTDALDDLVPAATADLVLGHGLLEVVDDVGKAIEALRAAAAVGGVVSVLVANCYATVLRWALAGHLVDARRLLDAPDGALAGTKEPLLRRFDVDGLRRALTDAGLVIETLQGDGVFADVVPGTVLEANPKAVERLTDLELAAASRPPLRDVAVRLHALARRTD